ncbi:MAG TPA: HAD family hydrolase [Candidatus Elarobacter sp.]
MRSIDCVLFDLDDTLHDDTAAYRTAARIVADEIAAERGIDAQRLADAYDAAAQRFWHELSSDHLQQSIGVERERMWSEALQEVGITDAALARRAADGYVAARSGALALFPGAAEVLDALRARGCKLGLVTNGFAATHHDKIDRLGLRERMDAFFLADEVGMVKPDPDLYRLACRTLGTSPERAAMVGDRYDRDVRGAHDVGLFTVLVDVHGARIPADGPRPDAIVQTIADVLTVLPLR